MLTLKKYGRTQNTAAAEGNSSYSIPPFLTPRSSPSAIPGSTGFLTDSTGAVNEHIEYTAWADATSNNINMRRAGAIATGCETWLESVNMPFYYLLSPIYSLAQRCTSKELDTQTHLYYFGARYYIRQSLGESGYDPKTSLWVSTDPILGRYLDAVGKGNSQNQENVLFLRGKGGQAGVLDSKNLGLYTYCHQNPLIYIDPDGNDVILLNESKAVGGWGHNAVLVGNDKNGWTYFGKEGLNNNLFVSFKTLDDFKNSEQAQKYDRAYGASTSEAQDNAMIEYGKENVNNNYSLIEAGKADNCADLSGDIIQAGNKVVDKDAKRVYISKPKGLGADVPNFQYMGFKDGNKENGYKVDLNER